MEFSERVTIDGKYFALRGARFAFHGVTYGTFAPRDDGALFPDRSQIKKDFHMMAESGITVVRTYTEPPEDLCELAGDWGIKLMAGVFYPDWRYLTGSSRTQRAEMIRRARTSVRAAARRHSADDNILALVIGNEIPADVVRWFGAKEIARVISELVEVVREEDPEQLVSYANYPTAEYLELSDLDFLTFNVFLEDPHDFRKYLARLHHMAGDRPLVMGELGLDASQCEQRQAELIRDQLQVAMERGVAGSCVFSWTDEWAVGGKPVDGWRFGLTRADRSPRPALKELAASTRLAVSDLRDEWPSMTVVICGHNAASTLEECLEHVCALDYPALEVIVVDDGSADTTPEIARRFPVKLIQEGWGGLSAARNLGCERASGEIVAYLDADAYPSPEWPYLLALGFDSPTVAGVGGPNLPPPHSTDTAQRVARAPGGPVHVLLTDDRAEHIPGCNMAFWKKAVVEVGAFDPAYVAAGDDVDLCWKLIDRGWEIAFHPSAVVWHHPRGSAKGYLRQQMGYGKAEALVAARHPNRFTGLGMARWRGLIYSSLGAPLFAQKIYRGIYGAGAFQSVYRADSHTIQIAHQLGVP
ncbi:MAG: glycosyltransferase, partial [Actinomycetota bacterium]